MSGPLVFLFAISGTVVTGSGPGSDKLSFFFVGFFDCAAMLISSIVLQLTPRVGVFMLVSISMVSFLIFVEWPSNIFRVLSDGLKLLEIFSEECGTWCGGSIGVSVREIESEF